METTVKNLENQTVIEFDLVDAYKELLIKAECYDLEGWFCPVFANIVNNELVLELGDLVLELGDPVSGNTFFMTNSWVDNIECWKFDGTADDYEEYGLSSPDFFDRNEIIKSMVSDYVDNFDFSELEENIRNFCNAGGFDIKFI